MSEDYTYEAATTFPDRVLALIAKLELENERTRLHCNPLALDVHNFNDRLSHMEAEMHKLLNPDGANDK